MPLPPTVWYKDKRTFRLGDVCRYQIRFTNRDASRTHIYFRAKNIEKAGLRAFHLVNGPFIVYCHVIPCNYDPHVRFVPESPANNEVCFRNALKPGQTFNVPLCLNGNSLDSVNADGSATYAWSCDVMCQIVLNRRAQLSFVVMVGEDLPEMRRASRSALTSLSKGDFAFSARDDEPTDSEWGVSAHAGLEVSCAGTDALWPRQPRLVGRPVHLVIVTHGIFSNLTADMLYLRDMLSSLRSDNYLVDGYRGNAGHTERGIHRLGAAVANYVAGRIAELRAEGHCVARLSFVGHSLGGPVQLYALKHILSTHGTDYFERQHISLANFVCLASPMLGVLSEISLWISWFLDLGTLGKTGRDLTLSKKLPTIKRRAGSRFGMVRPVLETLPDEPVQSALKSFGSRVVYANAVNDGIVPLRTSALLYLDWEALGDVRDLKDRSKSMAGADTSGASERSSRDTVETGGVVSASVGPSLTYEESREQAENDGNSPRNLLSRTATATSQKSTASSQKGTANSQKATASSQKGTANSQKATANSQKATANSQKSTADIHEKLPNKQANTTASNVGQIPSDSAINLSEKYTTFLSSIFNTNGETPSHKKGRRPKRIKKRIKRYARISAKGSDISESAQTQTDTADDEIGEVDDEVNSLNIPPKASAVESAFNSLICPIPSRDYIDDPETRTPVIFHDKFYHFDNVPKSESHTGSISKFFRYYDWRMDKQVKIARKYHSPDLSWRKVLVYLPPDAHNNIVVRRRFANGYGWGVIEHLRQEIFGGEKVAAWF